MGRWCSLAARIPVTDEVTGSNPVRPASRRPAPYNTKYLYGVQIRSPAQTIYYDKNKKSLRHLKRKRVY